MKEGRVKMEKTKCVECGVNDGRGKRNICRKCWRRDHAEKNKEKLQNQAQLRYLKNREHRLKELKVWKKKNMKRLNELRTKYYYENREKNIIRQKTRHYFGHLKKTGSCEICGTKEKLEFHHDEPYRFDKFKIFCPDCHAETEGRLLRRTGDYSFPKQEVMEEEK